jgi:(p)ppGpp synthase/HD superfamily hydrolase
MTAIPYTGQGQVKNPSDGLNTNDAGRNSNELLERAIRCALTAHAGQRYPAPESEPYILHSLRVMGAVEGANSQMAAVLHDVIEDTEVTLAELERAGYPDAVVHAVDCLTQREGEEYTAYIERLSTDPIATLVKVADLRDNLRNNRRLIPESSVLERIGRYERALAFLEPRLARLHADAGYGSEESSE